MVTSSWSSIAPALSTTRSSSMPSSSCRPHPLVTSVTLSARARPMKMKHQTLAAGAFSPPSPSTAAVSTLPFPPTNHKPCRVRHSAAAATSRWVNPRRDADAGGSAVNQRLHHLVRLGNLDAALLLVESMRDPERPAVVPCTLLIKKLCAVGRLDDTERVLGASERAGTADAVARNTLVAGYCHEGRLDDARRLMIRSACPPNDLTFGMMIHSLCQNGLVDRAMGVLDQMVKCGSTRGVIVYNKIISCLAELWRVEEALDLFNRMPRKPDIFSYNSVMKGLCRDEHEVTFNTLISYLCYRVLVGCAMEIVEQMPKYGCKPDNFTYGALVSALSEHGCVDDALELRRSIPWKPNTDVGKLLAEIIRNHLTLDEVAFGLLIDCLCQKGVVDYGAEVLGKMSMFGCSPDIIMYNSLINGFVENGSVNNALKLFKSISCKRNVVTYNYMLNGKLVAEMVKDECLPNEVTFSTLISYLCQKGFVERAIEVLEKMPKYNCMPNVIIYSTLINGLSEQDSVDDALKLLNNMPCKADTICYSAALKGLCRAERWEDTGELEMIRKNCPPDEVTFSILIDGLCHKGFVEYATKISELMHNYGCTPNIVIYSSIINGFSEQNRVEDALMLLRSMSCEPDTICYSAALKAEMFRKQCPLDESTFSMLIGSLCQNGLVDLATEAFEQIS
ncbi:hypothetical protein BS78_04G126500, partial [Paspalum vaginatum]